MIICTGEQPIHGSSEQSVALDDDIETNVYHTGCSDANIVFRAFARVNRQFVDAQIRSHWAASI